MRTPAIAANWKMFKTTHEALAYVRELGALIKDVSGIEVIVAPPFTAIATAAEAARNTAIGIAAQNMSAEKEGAFTGEVSATMVKDAGATYVILGHSERRKLYGETDASVNRKVHVALAADLVPIVCVGETLEEREGGQMPAVLDRQVKDGLDGLTGDHVGGLIIAYEPVWAIGTGRNATPEQADEAHRHIRTRLRQWFGPTAADACRIQYGGSVKPDNITALVALPDVDGALVGGASLNVASFCDIIRGAAAAR
ncbi:MAG: triose-phosphate isomerase [Acidobacteria bacterium]|nr:triose-phosphate isomerase [Acidobacteriota bacterium]